MSSDRQDKSFCLAELARTSGEWLRGDGPESDIVISSRVRLARNVAGFPFITRAAADVRFQIVQQVQAALKSEIQGRSVHHVNVETLAPLDSQLLMERQLISRELARGDGPRAVAIRYRAQLLFPVRVRSATGRGRRGGGRRIAACVWRDGHFR